MTARLRDWSSPSHTCRACWPLANGVSAEVPTASASRAVISPSRALPRSVAAIICDRVTRPSARSAANSSRLARMAAASRRRGLRSGFAGAIRSANPGRPSRSMMHRSTYLIEGGGALRAVRP